MQNPEVPIAGIAGDLVCKALPEGSAPRWGTLLVRCISDSGEARWVIRDVPGYSPAELLGYLQVVCAEYRVELASMAEGSAGYAADPHPAEDPDAERPIAQTYSGLTVDRGLPDGWHPEIVVAVVEVVHADGDQEWTIRSTGLYTEELLGVLAMRSAVLKKKLLSSRIDIADSVATGPVPAPEHADVASTPNGTQAGVAMVDLVEDLTFQDLPDGAIPTAGAVLVLCVDHTDQENLAFRTISGTSPERLLGAVLTDCEVLRQDQMMDPAAEEHDLPDLGDLATAVQDRTRPVSHILSGLSVAQPLPETWAPYGVIAIIEVLYPDGSLGWVHRTTAMPTSQFLGILTLYAHTLERQILATWTTPDPR